MRISVGSSKYLGNLQNMKDSKFHGLLDPKMIDCMLIRIALSLCDHRIATHYNIELYGIDDMQIVKGTLLSH